MASMRGHRAKVTAAVPCTGPATERLAYKADGFGRGSGATSTGWEAGQRRLRAVTGMAGWYRRCPRGRIAPTGFRCPQSGGRPSRRPE